MYNIIFQLLRVYDNPECGEGNIWFISVTKVESILFTKHPSLDI